LLLPRPSSSTLCARARVPTSGGAGQLHHHRARAHGASRSCSIGRFGAASRARAIDAAADAHPALPPPTPKQQTTGLRLDTDGWLREYDGCKAVTAEVVQLVQERNMNHPQGGPEASRLTASARRKLGTLGTSLDSLYAWLDGPEASEL
jgi:hypothetical protein